MRLNDIYKQIVDTGMKNDPRPRKEVAKALASAKKEYRSLKGARKIGIVSGASTPNWVIEKVLNKINEDTTYRTK